MGGVHHIAGLAAGAAGALYAFSKGSISPEALGIQRSVDGLVMVMLGGIQTLTGPVWGAALFTWLQDAAARNIDYWRAATGVVILALVLALPNGIGSLLQAKK
jgi:branched-chain amino acid transport system permease protein